MTTVYKPMPKMPLLPPDTKDDGKALIKAVFDHILNNNQRINQLQEVVADLEARYTTVPASATAAGTAGQYAADASYLYICHATNTWKRVGIAAW